MGLFSKKDIKDADQSIESRSGEEKSVKKNKDSYILCDHLSFAAKEAYKRLRTNVVFSFPDEGVCRIIGISSAQPSEGKSVTSVNLAYSMAGLGKRILLVDADLRRSSLHKKLNIKQTPGLSNLMINVSDVSSAITTYNCANDVSFDVIPGGDIPPNPSELLVSERMSKLFETLKSNYDYIIVDLPPVCAVVDAMSVSTNLDGMIIVIREQYTTKKAISFCVEQMSFSNAKILGFVVNGSLEGAGKNYGYRKYGYRNYDYGYGYGYGYGYRNKYNTDYGYYK